MPLADLVRGNVEARNRLIGGASMDWRAVLDQLTAAWERLRPFVRDVSVYLAEARRVGRAALYEGAQGTLLDIDHGTYPYVTASNATVGGVCTGLGVGPSANDAVIGVIKAYTTRVGDGPMPTELTGAMGDRLRTTGHEFGAVTGRPRRCGWFDAVVLRHAARVNGLDAEGSFKSWIRTGLSMIGFGFTIYSFLMSLPIESRGKEDPVVVGLFMIGIGTISILFGAVEYWETTRELHQDYGVKIRKAPLLFGLLIAGFGIVLFIKIAILSMKRHPMISTDHRET